MAQLMPLPLTVSCFSKIQIGLPFWYRLTRVVLDKGPLNGSLSLSLSEQNKCRIKIKAAVGQYRLTQESTMKIVSVELSVNLVF